MARLGNIFARLEELDRRWLYAALLLLVLAPMILKLSAEFKADPPVKMFYDYIESLAEKRARDKKGIVLVVCDWDAQTQAENYPQTDAVVRHLLRRHIPFAMYTSLPTGVGFLEVISNHIAREEGATYGEDYCIWGYKAGGSLFVMGLTKDVHASVKADYKGTPVEEIPMMREVHTARDITLVVEITGLVGALERWLQFFQIEGYRPDVAHGCTAVSYPSNYIYLDSGQLIGLMGGMAGAAGYESLLGSLGRGSQGMRSQSFAHVFIIGLIALGNIGMFVGRRKGGREVGGEEKA